MKILLQLRIYCIALGGGVYQLPQDRRQRRLQGAGPDLGTQPSTGKFIYVILYIFFGIKCVCVFVNDNFTHSILVV